MKYVSDERLKELSVNNPEFDLHIETLHKLVNRECKELPDQQWQTIDEFKDSGFVGLCWVFNNHGHVLAHNYDGEYFINPYMPNYPIHNNRIHSVMPIKTPEAPK